MCTNRALVLCCLPAAGHVWSSSLRPYYPVFFCCFWLYIETFLSLTSVGGEYIIFNWLMLKFKCLMLKLKCLMLTFNWLFLNFKLLSLIFKWFILKFKWLMLRLELLILKSERLMLRCERIILIFFFAVNTEN